MPLDHLKGVSHVADGLQLCAAGALEASSGAPDWVCIVPLTAGVNRIEARDGRVFIIEDAAALVAASNAELARQRGPHPIDKDHQMLSWWKGGGPALGWTDRYELRDDGIYAHVETWLTEGEQLIKSRQYRYTSCNVYCEMTNVVRDRWDFIESYDLLMKRFAGFTITNIPALEVYAMAAQENASMKRLFARLGLPETATPDDVIAAIEKLGEPPSLDKFVPRAEYDKLSADLAAARSQLASITEAAAEAEREQLLEAALKDGKVLPATASFYRDSMKQPGGVERFKQFCATAPQIGGPVKETRKPPEENPGPAGLSANELHACTVAGMTPEEYAKEKAAKAQRKPAA